MRKPPKSGVSKQRSVPDHKQEIARLHLEIQSLKAQLDERKNQEAPQPLTPAQKAVIDAATDYCITRMKQHTAASENQSFNTLLQSVRTLVRHGG